MNKKISDKEYIGSYITGLFEAVGCIYIPKNKRKIKIMLTLNKKNKPLLEIIKNRIGHGYIYEVKNTCNYEIYNKEGFKKVIEIISPYIRTPKINKINKLIEYLNKYKNCNISLAEIDNSELDKNGWLAGYLENSGSFTIYIRKDKEYIRHSVEFTLTCNSEDKEKNSYKPFMTLLAEYFNTKIIEKTIKGKKFYLVKLQNYKSINKLVEYLKKYPLYSIRYIDFKNFELAYQLNTDVELYRANENNYVQIMETIINTFNTKKINYLPEGEYFKVEHLDQFPKLDEEKNKD